MRLSASQTGRAKAALVFGDGADARAVIVTVIVRSRAPGSGERIRFTGPGVFEGRAARHIAEVVLSVVDHICRGVGVRRRRFEIAIANMGATAAANLGFAVTGLSADVPVLLAMLSVALGMPVPQNMVCTGHVASSDGRIALVSGIPAKLAATEKEGSIKTFIHPAFRQDASVGALAPAELQRATEAISGAPGNVRVIAVSNVAELVRTVFDDEAVVLASLRCGFFNATLSAIEESDPIGQALQFLVENGDARFWAAMERRLLAGDNDEARELLSARARFHVRRKAYPAGLGNRLVQLVRSLPPATRRLKITSPLLGMQDCIRLGQFATDADHEDVRLLIDATQGKNTNGKQQASSVPTALRVTEEASGSAALEAVLDEISADTLARRIGLPIDTARAVYHMDTVITESFDEFSEVVASYYLHLLRHTRSVPAGTEAHAVSAKALGLLEEAFAKQGGRKAALAEARDGTHGGLRFVLDAMTERFKADQQADYVRWVLKQALDPDDWDATVAFTAALLRRLAPDLPAEIRALPAERLANHYESIVQAYARSVETVRVLLRTL